MIGLLNHKELISSDFSMMNTEMFLSRYRQFIIIGEIRINDAHASLLNSLNNIRQSSDKTTVPYCTGIFPICYE